MKTATIRDLLYDFGKIEAWLASGEDIVITRHRKPVAQISKPVPIEENFIPSIPDFAARRRRIWGDRVFSAAEVEEMRAFETGEP